MRDSPEQADKTRQKFKAWLLEQPFIINAEAFRELRTTTAEQSTDDAPPSAVLAEVARCAMAWEPEARILGNVRAGDIARACIAYLNREA